MIRECHEVTSILVHKMLDRARVFTSSGLHDEKMVSLGKLSAGLAHELNNPASAIERSASLLEDRLEEAEQATRALGAAQLTDAQLARHRRGARVLPRRRACTACCRRSSRPSARTPSPTGWPAHGVDAAIAGTAGRNRRHDRGARPDCRRGATDRRSTPCCDGRPPAARCAGSRRRFRKPRCGSPGLVMAIKGFTHMDQATVAEPVDLAMSLGNTVAVLQAKARSKSVAVVVDVEPDLPRVRGFVGELNQIWANLIDNALDAVPDAGRVEVTAARERQRVVVRVVDNGPGIPDRRPRPPVRAVLHHQAGRQGHRPGPRHRPAPGHPQRRRHRRRVEAGTNGVPRLAAARRRRRRAEAGREQARPSRRGRRPAGARGGAARSARRGTGSPTRSSARRPAKRRSPPSASSKPAATRWRS